MEEQVFIVTTNTIFWAQVAAIAYGVIGLIVCGAVTAHRVEEDHRYATGIVWARVLIAFLWGLLHGLLWPVYAVVGLFALMVMAS